MTWLPGLLAQWEPGALCRVVRRRGGVGVEKRWSLSETARGEQAEGGKGVGGCERLWEHERVRERVRETVCVSECVWEREGEKAQG